MSFSGRARALFAQPNPINFRTRTRDLLAACTVKPALSEQLSLNRLVSGLEDNGIIPYMDRLYCILLHDEQASRLDLINPGTDTLVKVNSPTFIPYQGWKGDGISMHLTSTFAPSAGSKYQANASFLGCWSMYDKSEASFDVYIGGTANVVGGIRPRNGASMLVRSNATAGDTLLVSDGMGFSASLRDGASSGYVLRDKAVSLQKVTTAEGRPTGTLNLLRVSAGNLYSSGVVCVVAVGAIPTLTMYNTFCDLITNYLVEIGAWTTPVDPDPPPSGANYFTSATAYPDDGAVTLGSLRVMRALRPPTSNLETSVNYTGFPITDVANNLVYTTSTWTGMKWWFGWHLRANNGWNKRANPIAPRINTTGGVECRAEYSSKAKANAAYKVQCLYVMGAAQAVYEAVATAAGFSVGDILAHATLKATPATYFTSNPTMPGTPYKVMIDKIWLPPAKLTDQASPRGGIIVDYEVGDSRTPAETYAQLDDLITTFQSYGFQGALYTNSFNASTQAYTGLNSRDYLWQLHAKWDFMFVFLWSRSIEGNITASWNNQIDMLKGPARDKAVNYSKIAINFELGIRPGTSDSDAEAVRAIIVANSIPLLYIWPNYATLGGAGTRATNRKQSMVCFGRYSV